MHALLASLLHRLRASRRAGACATGATEALHAQPRIEAGSTLHTMAELDPVQAAAFADAFAAEIDRAIAQCTLGAASTRQEQALQQIHALKNTLSLTGSQPLLRACDQLRDDVERGACDDTLAHRFTAVATAAALLVEQYRRTLPSDDTDLDA
ncbi:hypothetical protein JWH11_19510 [Xanthomonas melonis]|uniref:HPt domain-containing protein n=1 Tax=Xanthomonas melonis TaxID=56456 RepID=A0ABS8NZR8_9XANT|nr:MULTISPECIES: hypothetical protein [Xanthomonas]MCC4586027.1 hypothetical protein [Xanthomonas sp. NCPPB 1067]MCD0246457.1 hypothetical protein [Xanthomonas melonis]MCD0260508.1 hypothetical protein [Xanthomonas melonis]MCD0268582.1 hypothetical protein [Xanthomonas melonis]